MRIGRASRSLLRNVPEGRCDRSLARSASGVWPEGRHDAEPMDRGRESASSPSLRTGQALFTHPALQLMGSNSETEDFEFYDSLWRYRPCSRAAVRLNSPASSKKRLRHR